MDYFPLQLINSSLNKEKLLLRRLAMMFYLIYDISVHGVLVNCQMSFYEIVFREIT